MRISSKGGFTLTELLVVVVVFSLVLGATMNLVSSSIQAREDVAATASLQEQAEGAMDTLMSAVMAASQVVSATGGLRLRNPDGSEVAFTRSGTALSRTAPAPTLALSSDVNALTITLLDSAGNAASSPSDAAQVDISLSLRSSNGVQASSISSARLRNR